MDIQRLRNLTTGRLHTTIDHVYEDLEYLIGVKGLMTHQIPNADRALKPYLRKVVTDQRFWDGEYDVTHVGEFEIKPAADEDRCEILDSYSALPSPFAGK